MGPSDKAKFGTLIAQVAEFYGKADGVTEFTLKVWWGALQQYDYAAIESAFGRHCVDPDRGHFMPRPADVVRILDGTTLDSAQQAWSKVIDAIHHVGTYASVCFDDPIINKVLSDMGGWIPLGQVAEKELPYKQKEFQERYRALKLRGVGAWPRYLAGLIECENGAKGLRGLQYIEPPKLLGDKERAKLVYEQGGDGYRLITAQPVAALIEGKDERPTRFT